MVYDLPSSQWGLHAEAEGDRRARDWYWIRSKGFREEMGTLHSAVGETFISFIWGLENGKSSLPRGTDWKTGYSQQRGSGGSVLKDKEEPFCPSSLDLITRGKQCSVRPGAATCLSDRVDVLEVDVDDVWCDQGEHDDFKLHWKMWLYDNQHDLSNLSYECDILCLSVLYYNTCCLIEDNSFLRINLNPVVV